MSETKDIPSIPFCMLGTSIPKVGRKLLRFPPTRFPFLYGMNRLPYLVHQ